MRFLSSAPPYQATLYLTEKVLKHREHCFRALITNLKSKVEMFSIQRK